MVTSAAAGRVRAHFLILVVFCSLVVLLAACGPADNEDSQPTANPIAIGESTVSVQPGTGYPGPELTVEPYPGSASPDVEGILTEPPDPARNLSPPQGEFGAIGGVLVRTMTDQGYLPVTPRKLVLGEVLSNNFGTPSYIRSNEESLQAELFSTGVFRFGAVPPGTYGLVIDLGFTQFPILGPEGGDFLITVQAGQVYDLGQIFVNLPNES